MSEANGHSPAPPPAATEPQSADTSERMMGIFGLAVALGIGLIAVDLLTGGALSRMVGRPAEGDNGDGG